MKVFRSSPSITAELLRAKNAATKGTDTNNNQASMSSGCQTLVRKAIMTAPQPIHFG